MLQIRKIKPEDIQFVLELAEENNCSQGKLLSNIEHFLVCESGNQRCGCGCLVPAGSEGFMNWVLVKKEYRRKKLGGAITKALLNIADINGIKAVYAAAPPTGICGEFLTAMGFEKSSLSGGERIKEVLGVESNDCYRVSLEGYFKPCSQK